MAKQNTAEQQTSGIQYRRAKTWHIALSQMTGIMQMAFYVLLGYAAYIGNLGFAITTALVGVLITISRVFDSVTDPIIALLIEKFNSKHGKMRFFLFIGWLFMAGATTLMCNVFAGKFSFGADEMVSEAYHLSYQQASAHESQAEADENRDGGHKAPLSPSLQP